MNTTYTIVDSTSGHVSATGLTAVQAAHEILAENGAAYELRFDPKHDVAGEHLYELAGTTRFSREFTAYYSHNRSIITYAANEADAWEKLAPMVITAGWPGHSDVMTDADYNAMAAEALAGEVGDE